MQLHDAEAHDIILDSGADMSCLPLSYAEHGTSHGSSGLQLRDAQGEALALNDLREVEFVVQSEEGEPIVWREVCAVAPLRSCCCVKASSCVQDGGLNAVRGCVWNMTVVFVCR